MSISRYTNVSRLRRGTMIGTSVIHTVIYNAVMSGKISSTEMVMKERGRLDTLAGEVYNDSGYWWIIAAASGIGWGLQIPPGTVVKIPMLNDILNYVR